MRTGWVGQAHIDLLALSANYFLELPQTRTKPPSEHAQRRSSQREQSERAMRRRLCVVRER